MDTNNPIDLTVPSPSPGTADCEEENTGQKCTYSEVQATVRKKISKPSVLPTFLPPCRVCNAKASGLHYGT